MMTSMSRRMFFGAAPGAVGAAVGAAAIAGPATLRLQDQDVAAEGSQAEEGAAVYHGFPAQDPARVREIVGVSHGNFERVRELVEASPALAKASWDWGFGDWESPLGAASHTGNRDIAIYLIEHGARPTIFSAAMLGQLAVVKAYIEASPGVQRTPGPHGITLLSHAKFGGEQAKEVLEYLESVGGADPQRQSAPLQRDVSAYLGTFEYAPGGEGSRFIVTEREGALRLAHGSGFPRALHHVGGDAFYPSGAPAVRIAFSFEDGGERAASLSVLDPDPLVTAARTA